MNHWCKLGGFQLSLTLPWDCGQRGAAQPLEVVGVVKAFEISSGFFPRFKNNLSRSSSRAAMSLLESSGRRGGVTEGTMGVPLFPLRGTTLSSQAEGAVGLAAPRRPAQGCVGGQAC